MDDRTSVQTPSTGHLGTSVPESSQPPQPEAFLECLGNTDVSEAEKLAYLYALAKILRHFIDLGFDINTVSTQLPGLHLKLENEKYQGAERCLTPCKSHFERVKCYNETDKEAT